MWQYLFIILMDGAYIGVLSGFIARVKKVLHCFVGILRDAGIIDEENSPGNRKEKIYRITESGETDFRFFF